MRKIKHLESFRNFLFNSLKGLLLVFIFQQVHAQHIEWGTGPKKNRSGFAQILGENEQGIYVLRARNAAFTQELALELYKNNLSYSETFSIPLAVPGTVERVLLLDGIIHVFLSAQNNTTGKIDFLHEQLAPNGTVSGDVQVLFSLTPEQMDDKSAFYIKTNALKNRFAIFFLANANIPDKSELAVFCYDAKVKQIYFKTELFPVPVKDVFINAYDLTNEGDFCVLTDIPADLNKRNDRDHRAFSLHVYFNAQDVFRSYAIGDNEHRVQDITLCVNNFAHLIQVYGFQLAFDRKSAPSQLYAVVDCAGDKSLRCNRFAYFNPDKAKRQQAANLISDVPDLYIRKMVPRSDGGCILIAEKYNVTRQPYTYYINGFPQTNMRIIYNYEDLYVIHSSPSGECEQFDVLNKSQSTGNDASQYASMVPIITPDNVYMVFNSDIGLENDLMLGYLNSNGTLDKRILVKAINGSGLVMTNEWKQMSTSTVICCAIKNKRFTLMRITF